MTDRILVAQPLHELDGKRGRRAGPRRPTQADRSRVRRAPAEREHLVREGVGLQARGPPAHDPLRHASEVLHEDDPQGDGDGPQLADGERLHALVGRDESTERLGVEPAIGVRDERPRQSVDAGIARQGAVGQLGQLAIEPGREIVADLPQLLVDDVEVVDEPFGRRNDRPLLADGVGDHAIRLAQDAAVVLDARQQAAVLGSPRDDGLRGRQALGVLLEALDAEELGADRVLDDRGGAQHADPHVVAPRVMSSTKGTSPGS